MDIILVLAIFGCTVVRFYNRVPSQLLNLPVPTWKTSKLGLMTRTSYLHILQLPAKLGIMEPNRGPRCQLPAELLRMVMESIEWAVYADKNLKPTRKKLILARSTLRSALLVNKAWAAEAIGVLWKNPPVSALTDIEDRDRRQLYAYHVRKLEVGPTSKDDDETIMAKSEYWTLLDMEMPQLKFIDIHNPTNHLGVCLRAKGCIRPSLEEVHFGGFDLDPITLHLLGGQCPNLKKIAFHVGIFYGSGIRALTELIDRCKSMRSIRLQSDGAERNFLEEHEFDSEIEFDAGASRAQHERLVESFLWSLAHCNGLEELKMNTMHEYKTFSGVLRSLEQPFKDLRTLTIGTVLEERSVSLLASKLNPDSLTALHLKFNGTTLTTNPLQQIALLVNLQNLSITYVDETVSLREYPLSYILPLKNLKRLRSLEISNLPFSPELTDEVFIAMVENWPELEILHFVLSYGLSTTSLISLGKHCPRLKDFISQGEYDLNDWENIPRPIFPQLQGIILFGLVDRERESQ